MKLFCFTLLFRRIRFALHTSSVFQDFSGSSEIWNLMYQCLHTHTLTKKMCTPFPWCLKNMLWEFMGVIHTSDHYTSFYSDTNLIWCSGKENININQNTPNIWSLLEQNLEQHTDIPFFFSSAASFSYYIYSGSADSDFICKLANKEVQSWLKLGVEKRFVNVGGILWCLKFLKKGHAYALWIWMFGHMSFSTMYTIQWIFICMSQSVNHICLKSV